MTSRDMHIHYPSCTAAGVTGNVVMVMVMVVMVMMLVMVRVDRRPLPSSMAKVTHHLKG